jgi:ribosomal protein S7
MKKINLVKTLSLPKKNIKSNLYSKFLNFFFLQGKKSSIKKKIDSVFTLLAKELLYSANHLLLIFFKRLKSYVEIKKIKKRRRTFLVPVPITHSRRIYLALSWLSSSIQLNKNQIPFERKLYDEVLNILLNQRCNTLISFEKNHKLAVESRIHLHYRW